jgi:hypothetical protein
MFVKHPMSGCERQLPYFLRTEQLTFVYLSLPLLKTLLDKGIQILMVFQTPDVFKSSDVFGFNTIICFGIKIEYLFCY